MAERYRPPKCRDCGALGADGVYISFRGRCTECGLNRMLAAMRQVKTGEGPAYDRWVAGMIEAAQRRTTAPVDVDPSTPDGTVNNS